MPPQIAANPNGKGPKWPRGQALRFIVERLRVDPQASLAAIALELGVTRQSVRHTLERHRPDLLEARRHEP